jgi:hypothetical protein
MDKVKKQQTIAALQSIFSSIQMNGSSSYKLWHYTVGIACGLSKPLITDPQYKDKPIVSLFSFSGYSSETDYDKRCGWYNVSIQEIIDCANEVNSFDLDKANEICYQTWAHRQSMVFPMALAVKAKSCDAISSTIGACISFNNSSYECFNETENQAVIIAVNNISKLIDDITQWYKDNEDKPVN